MKKTMSLLTLMAMVMLVSGCYTTGLSLREKGDFNYSNFVYGLYNEDSSTPIKEQIVDKPIKLAIAQVGENTPPNLMLNRLSDEKYLISKIAVIPAAGSQENYQNNNINNSDFTKRMIQMRKLAKDLGMDYIFLFGGSADYGSTANWLQFFDLTVVGGFIIPSNKITAEARAAGALIDVDTGRVLFVVSAEGKKQEHAPTYTAESRQQDVIVSLRDELVQSLTKEFIEKLNKYNRS